MPALISKGWLSAWREAARDFAYPSPPRFSSFLPAHKTFENIHLQIPLALETGAKISLLFSCRQRSRLAFLQGWQGAVGELVAATFPPLPRTSVPVPSFYWRGFGGGRLSCSLGHMAFLQCGMEFWLTVIGCGSFFCGYF